MNNLAVLYRRHGQYEKAEPLYLSSLETKRAALGENHPDTLITMNGLGILYFNHGEFVKAESIWTDCLKLREAYLGVNHRDTIDTRNSLDKLRAVQLENKG
jgi:Flp pilus assembly protein TadD